MAYQHAKAFALMWYACTRCPHTERAWNSRDGVTPFAGISCPSCGGGGLDGGLRHISWQEDHCKPDHQPREGQLIFRDGTPAEAVAIIRRRIALAESIEPAKAIPDDVQAQLLAEARTGTGDWQKGWPIAVRFPLMADQEAIARVIAAATAPERFECTGCGQPAEEHWTYCPRCAAQGRRERTGAFARKPAS